MSLRNKKKILAKIAPVFTSAGIHHWFGSNWRGMGTILMFHRILPRSSNSRVHNHESLEIDPFQLQTTIDYFKRKKYDFISIEQLPLYQNQSERKFVVFTFDDGYVDNLTNAYPIFKKHGIPFTIYITTNFINRRAVVWWYLLEEILQKNDHLTLSWKGRKRQYQCRNAQEKDRVFSYFRNLIMRELDPSNSIEDFQELFGDYVDDLYEYTNQHMLTWEQIEELAKDPLVTIAAHTVNHLPLRLLSHQQLEIEIKDSQRELSSRLDLEINHFAYPFGKHDEANEREFELVDDLGFRTGVTTRIGNVLSLKPSDLQKLPRVNVNRYTTKSILEMHTSGFISWMKSLKLNL